MKYYLKIVASFFAFSCIFISSANSQVSFRGFQVDYKFITEQEVASLANDWKVNIIRIQLGNDRLMDSVEGIEYLTMMANELVLLDNALALFSKYNLQVVINLYSPPGGFQSRTAPSHYRMFSRVDLQDAFFVIWDIIARKYANNPIIYGFDLVNEPARRPELLCAGCRDWPQLALETFNLVRAIVPNKKIFVKSLYGDPSELINLPLISDENIIYTYHAYPFFDYQHAGIAGISVDVKRPRRSQIEAALARPLNRFGQKIRKAFRKKLVPYSEPPLSVGEFAVSSCSSQRPERFLKDIIRLFEKNNSRRRKRRSRYKRRFKPFIKHFNWTNHAFGDAQVWDPRLVCSVDGNFVATNSNARGEVLKKFFGRN